MYLYNHHKILITLLILSFILFFFNIDFQTKKFGKILKHQDGTEYHGIIKSPPELNIWKKASEFKSDISIKNLQPYEFRHHFLPPKILSFSSNIFKIEFYDKQKNIDIKNLNYFFYFQIIFYYLCVILFYSKLIKINIKKSIINITVCFLIFEPTINQYNSTIFGETIFFSLLILIFTYLIDLPKKNFNYFLLGILFAFLYLQRSVAMFLIMVPILILLIQFKYDGIQKIVYLIIPFLIVLFLLGSLNYKRAGIFYFLPTQTIDNLYNYFLPKVDSKIFNTTSSESKEKLKQIKNDFAIKNNLDLSEESDRIKFYNFQRDESMTIMMNNKLIVFKEALISSIHSSLLNPVEIINTRIKGKDYYKSDLHKKYIKYRIFYSFFIYLIILIGFFYSIKKKYIAPHILLVVGIYFFVISSWVGYTRYFVPTLLSLCLYFGCGLDFLIKFMKKQKLA
tara:strand:+ start:2033 stop:3388 length:1356 start_codon:yes stop_codon:yes gene_type:complete